VVNPFVLFVGFVVESSSRGRPAGSPGPLEKVRLEKAL
jgi:hypothetical protein